MTSGRESAREREKAREQERESEKERERERERETSMCCQSFTRNSKPERTKSEQSPVAVLPAPTHPPTHPAYAPHCPHVSVHAPYMASHPVPEQIKNISHVRVLRCDTLSRCTCKGVRESESERETVLGTMSITGGPRLPCTCSIMTQFVSPPPPPPSLLLSLPPLKSRCWATIHYFPSPPPPSSFARFARRLLCGNHLVLRNAVCKNIRVQYKPVTTQRPRTLAMAA